MKRKVCSGIVFILVAIHCYSQSPDILRLEYTSMSSSFANLGFSRVKLLGNLPLKGKSDHFFVVGAEFNSIVYHIQTELPFDDGPIKNLYMVDLNLAYVYKWNNDWRIIGVVTPRVASNFVNGWENDDLNLNMTMGAYKDKQDVDRPYRLVLGLSYNSAAVVRIPLPVVYFEKMFHPNWSYTVGVPKTGLKYITDKKHFVQTEIVFDGHYVNLQNGIVLPNNQVSSVVSSIVILATMGYQYKFTKDISIYGVFGRTLWQNGVLRNDDRSEVFALNKQPSLYFRTGFRIGI